MNSLFKLSRKRILLTYFIMFVLLIVGVNIGTQVVNSYYREKIIDQENKSFIELYFHLLEFSTPEDTKILIEHYSHVNNAKLIVMRNNDLIFTTDVGPLNFMEYTETYNDDVYYFKIDNSNSYVAIIRDTEILQINIILFTTMSLLILYFIYSRRKRGQKTIHDLKVIQHLIESRKIGAHHFYFHEFHNIYHDIASNISTIDLLLQKRIDNLNGLVHDLKTPITIIKYHLDNETDINENKEAIIQSLNDLSNIASDLISERFQGVHSRINLSKTVVAELKKYEETFNSKDMIIKSTILDDIYVNFNKRDLIRVLQNLLTNAFYYSFKNTNVYVNLVHNRDSYNLEIINKGDKLSDEKLETIFNKDISYDSSDSNNGIGLYITKLLVEDAGATISAKSEESGNRFMITFPQIDN